MLVILFYFVQHVSGDVKFCRNPRCQALQHQVYLLQEEFEESKKRVTCLEKTVAHLQQEKNSDMEQCSLAKVEVLHVCFAVISKL